jgi:hypothetical protein
VGDKGCKKTDVGIPVADVSTSAHQALYLVRVMQEQRKYLYNVA